MSLRSLVSACLLFFGMLAVAGCSGGSGNTPVSCGLCGGGPTATGTYVYSAGVNNGVPVVLSLPTTSTGMSATATLAANVGTGGAIYAMQTDGAGTLYVLASQGSGLTVSVYTYTMSAGTLTPVRSFTAVLPAPLNYGMALSKTGKLYLSAQDGYVYAFPTTASGSTTYTASTRLYHGFTTMTTDAAGNLYGSEGGYVYQYSPDFASTTPTRTINAGGVGTIAADSTGRVFVSNGATPGTIVSYAAGSSTVTATLSGSSTGLAQYSALFLDGSGNLWASSPGSTVTATRSFQKFTSYSGNIAPAINFSTSSYLGSTSNPSLVVY